MKTNENHISKEIIDIDVTWQQITPGGLIADGGNSHSFYTGDWRILTPFWHAEACRQCLLCFPVCPDSAIPVNEDGRRINFDYNHCKGCGVCANVCPFNAIEMLDESKQEVTP